jgi:sec-independent protein translocase protein TatA
MIPNVGLPELALIVFLAMLFFGKDKLPELAKGVGNSIKEFRGAVSLSEDKEDVKVETSKAKKTSK